jgi:hypothetical protein
MLRLSASRWRRDWCRHSKSERPCVGNSTYRPLHRSRSDDQSCARLISTPSTRRSGSCGKPTGCSIKPMPVSASSTSTPASPRLKAACNVRASHRGQSSSTPLTMTERREASKQSRAQPLSRSGGLTFGRSCFPRQRMAAMGRLAVFTSSERTVRFRAARAGSGAADMGACWTTSAGDVRWQPDRTDAIKRLEVAVRSARRLPSKARTAARSW